MSEEREEYQNPPGRGREGFFPELSKTMWPYQKPLSQFSSLEREKINFCCFKPVRFMETSSRYFLSKISRKKNHSVKQSLEVIVRAIQLHEEQLRKLLHVDTCSHKPTAMSSVIA